MGGSNAGALRLNVVIAAASRRPIFFTVFGPPAAVALFTYAVSVKQLAERRAHRLLMENMANAILGEFGASYHDLTRWVMLCDFLDVRFGVRSRLWFGLGSDFSAI
jgi:hypothetical protein